MSQERVTLMLFAQYVKKVGHSNNELENHKRRLSKVVSKVEDYIECFKTIDLDRRGVLYPQTLQNFLISNKYYFTPLAIRRFYNKYSHEKGYLSYEDVLQSLLPCADYLLFATTISKYQQSPKQEKALHSCERVQLDSIKYLTAFVISEELRLLEQDYSLMTCITHNSLSIGATLWRLLDRNHNNLLTFEKLKPCAQECGVELAESQWSSFLYWHFHSYKQSITRDLFMRMLDIQESRKRTTSAARIDMFKLQSALYQRAAEDRARNKRILSSVQEKLQLVSRLEGRDYLNLVREEHFPFGVLGSKRQLGGKKGYSNPKGLIKSVIQRP